MLGVRGLSWAAVLVVIVFTPSHAHIGSCEDHTPECLQWALNGYCDSQRQFMLSNCPVSCNLCLDPNCFDTSPNCEIWVRRGYCRSFRNRMIQVCPHSCDACNIRYPTIGSLFSRFQR